MAWQGEASPNPLLSGGAERRLSFGKLFALTVASFRGSDAARRVPTIVNWGETTTKVAPDKGGAFALPALLGVGLQRSAGVWVCVLGCWKHDRVWAGHPSPTLGG